MSETSAENCARRITAQLPDVMRGSLRFFGDWFGRPHDNLHQIIGADASGDVLVLKFDDGETLEVQDPSGLTADEHEFRIRRASRITWRWYAYGRPKTEANLYRIDHRLMGDQVESDSTVDWYEPEFHTSPNANAVEILF